MVLIRDVSHAVRVDGEPVVVASLVLDAETGLARGMSIGQTDAIACVQAMRSALTQPAGPLPPERPGRVLCGIGHRAQVAAGLARVLDDGLGPAVTEVVSVEAEDILDSFVGHMAGRRQPEEFASPADWRLLLDAAGRYRQVEPWQRWADDVHLDLVVRIDGTPARYVAVVIGQEGIQRGLVLYPGGALPPDLIDWRPGSAVPLPAGTILCYLDPPRQAPPEFVAKAARYGWAPDADLIPVWLSAGPDGPADLDRSSVHRLTLAITAVLAHHHDKPSTGRTAGTLTLAGGQHGEYTIDNTNWAEPPATGGRT